MPKKSSSALPPVQTDLEWLGTEIASFRNPKDDSLVSTLRLWLERPTGQVVGFTLGEPDTLEPFAETFLKTARKPMVGRSRLPGSVRVSDSRLAAELEAIPELRTQVVNAPTPELEELIKEMTKVLDVVASEDDVEKHDVRIVERLFEMAALLYKLAPWKVATEDQVIQVDIAELGVREACLSIVGNADQSCGFLLFRSLEGYLNFVEAASQFVGGDDPLLPDASWLALTFVSAADLPPGRLHQAKQHRWPVAARNAYPDVFKVEMGEPSVIEDRDLRILTSCAHALVNLVGRNGTAMFEREVETSTQMFTGSDGTTVRLTYPILEAPFGFVDQQDLVKPAKVGRNDPCPCGSGKKFKKCCLHKEESSGASTRDEHGKDRTSGVHEMDERLVARMLEAALKRFGREVEPAFHDFHDPQAAGQLTMAYVAYCFAIKGQRMVSLLLDNRKEKLSLRERGWLEAQCRAWLSIWEIVEIERGVALTVVDLLTGERRRVLEKLGSEQANRRDTILGRVVDFEDTAVFCGSHPQALPPAAANRVVTQVKRYLNSDDRVSIESLQEYDVCRQMLKSWEDEVDATFQASMQNPVLSNTDGDPLWLTVDRYHVDPMDLKLIESKLKRIKDVIPPDPSAEKVYTFEPPGKPGDPFPSTTTATVRFDGATLVAETNSVKRADALREKLEAAFGPLLHFAGREERDPWSVTEESEDAEALENEIPAEIRHQVIRDFKVKHYASWPDISLPALQGKTPREAARTTAGRRQLDVMLKEIEHSEQRLHPDERFDFAPLRAELGLDQ